METSNKKHPFLRTLGPGPYRFLTVFTLVLPSEHNQGRNNFHLAPKGVGCGTCAHCGHGIIHNYIVQTGEGKRFAVGSDCIMKMHMEGDFENYSDFERKMALEKRQKGKEQRERRRVKQAAEVLAVISANEAKLKSLPHPSKHYASSKTAYDYCMFCYNDGRASLGAIKFLKAKLKEWAP